MLFYYIKFLLNFRQIIGFKKSSKKGIYRVISVNTDYVVEVGFSTENILGKGAEESFVKLRLRQLKFLKKNPELVLFK